VTTRDYVDWVQFKLEMVADFYERYCSESIIGRPIDSFAFSPSEYEASTMVVEIGLAPEEHKDRAY